MGKTKNNINSIGKILLYSSAILLFFILVALTKSEFLENLGIIYEIIFLIVSIFWFVSYLSFGILIIHEQLKVKKYFWGVANILLFVLVIINSYSVHWILEASLVLLSISLVSYYFIYLKKK